MVRGECADARVGLFRAVAPNCPSLLPPEPSETVRHAGGHVARGGSQAAGNTVPKSKLQATHLDRVLHVRMIFVR